MPEIRIRSGRFGDWNWLCATPTVDYPLLSRLITSVPSVVRNRHVAITSFDSGPLKPSEDEQRWGWRAEGDVLWTGQITDPDVLPMAGYDEWYVYDRPVVLQDFQVFVNYPDFRLYDPELILREDPTWEPRAVELQLRCQRAFWEQIARLAPSPFWPRMAICNS
jgi:hypothetical protein